MEVIKFTLKGKFAFFKKPDVNTYLYFSYGNIHKVTLLGLFGAILGYKGYNQMDFNKRYKKDFKEISENIKSEYPEFYSRLKHMKISITPGEVSIAKKVQIFNNSVGYASQEQGGNLIVKEQWLENPSWEIYVVIEDEEGQKLAKALLESNFAYIPYLGKNDHPADISDVLLIKGVNEADKFNKISSLYIKEDFEIVEQDDNDGFDEKDVPIFKYEEKLPVSLEEKTNKYEFKSFVYTNADVKRKSETKVYKIDGKNIVFF